MIRAPDPLLESQVVSEENFHAISLKKNIVGGRGGTRTRGPCLLSRLGKTLNTFAGVAYTETAEIPAPQMSRSCTEVFEYSNNRCHDSNLRTLRLTAERSTIELPGNRATTQYKARLQQ